MIGALMEPDLFTVVRRGVTGKDALGKPVTSVISSTVEDGLLEQTGSAEGEAFVVNKFRAFFLVTADVRSGDEVQCRGRSYTVEGEPSVERVPGFPAVSNLTGVLKYVGPVTP